jgi:cob(I)alamin adenosyltransferase
VDKTAKRRRIRRNYLRPSESIADSPRRIRCLETLEELISHIGFARSICLDIEVRKNIEALQINLYRIGAIIVAPNGAKKMTAPISPAMMDALEVEIHRIKRLPGVLGNGSLFWEQPASAALEIARNTSRRAERLAKILVNTGEVGVPLFPVYLNRLAELLWLLGRLLESRQCINPRPGNQAS